MHTPFRFVLAVAASLFAAAGARAQSPLGTAFTYQGELASAGTPATGAHDIRFRVFDAETGGNQIGTTLCSDNLAVANGQFVASLDFGAVFAGQKRYLEIEVRQDTGLDCSDATGYTLLSPRQELAATPNATFAQTAESAASATTALTATNAASLNGQSPSFYQNAANLTGTLADARLSNNVARLDGNQTFTGQTSFSNPANTFSGIFSGNGASLLNLNGASINAGTIARSALSGDVQGGVGTVVFDLSLAGSVMTAGRPISVAVSGSFAYVVTSSNTLQVFDFSTPTAPTLVGSVATGNNPQSIAVSGSLACVVNNTSNTLQVFDISNPAAPALAGSVATANGPISVAVSGSFAYVVYGLNTLQVFNISNPAAPTLAGSIANQLIVPRCIAVSGPFAYVVDIGSDRLKVFNISNPAAPTLAGSVATGWFPYSVAVSGSFAYVVCRDSDTLQVFDISNPAAITLAGSVATDDVPYYISVSGSYAHVVNAGSNTLQVFNINNPATPTLAGRVAAPAYPIFVATSGSLAYVLNDNTLMVFNTLGVRFGTPLAAASLVGVDGSRLTGVNAATATTAITATTATNATQLNSQPASFYTNASNITTGTLADTQLSTNVARTNRANAFGNFTNTFAGNVGIGTTSPDARLHVTGPNGSAFQVNDFPSGSSIQLVASFFGNAAGPQVRFQRAAGGPFIDIGQNATNDFVVETNDTARLIVNSTTGNVQVVNSLSKGGGSFKIDHPLDPENKYLYHSFVESPDMMNVYNGNVVTDADGYATITLPDYFEALNRDFRYSLTVIDENAPDIHFVRIARKISGNQFTVRSTPGNLEISWQVTGIRKDAWAEKNRIPNSVDKPAAEKGKYLHPEAFDEPVTQGVHFAPAANRQPVSK